MQTNWYALNNSLSALVGVNQHPRHIHSRYHTYCWYKTRIHNYDVLFIHYFGFVLFASQNNNQKVTKTDSKTKLKLKKRKFNSQVENNTFNEMIDNCITFEDLQNTKKNHQNHIFIIT